VLRGVNFDFDKANIRSDAEPILDAAASSLQAEQPVSIGVEGHTDSTGSDDYNQGLSIRRATAVRDYLEKKGIDAARMTIEGYGETKPVASNDTEEGRAQNRRVELRVAE
jgi:outer membrane protein OmpA-like peptidoglycan-associated protein